MYSVLTRSLEKTGADRPLDFIPFSFHRDPPVILNFLPCHLICIHDRLDDPPPPLPLPPRSSFPQMTLRSDVAGRRRATSYPIPTATDLNWNLDPLDGGGKRRGTSRRLRSVVVDVLPRWREGRGGAEDTEIVDRIVPLTTSIRSNHSGWEKTKKGGYSGERVQARLPLDLWRRRTRRYAPSNIDFSISPRYTLDIRGKYRG